ncbi:hypothetical protein FRC01_003670 [Tulasnella sp. 417]|nr:hypothetical protein FRC01_003670 [Tulasnella sp. 417]
MPSSPSVRVKNSCNDGQLDAQCLTKKRPRGLLELERNFSLLSEGEDEDSRSSDEDSQSGDEDIQSSDEDIQSSGERSGDHEDTSEAEDPETAQIKLERVVRKYTTLKSQRDRATSERPDIDAQIQLVTQEKRKAEEDLRVSEVKRRKLEEELDAERNKEMKPADAQEGTSQSEELLQRERDLLQNPAEGEANKVKELENLLSTAVSDTLQECKKREALQEQVQAMAQERDALRTQLQAEQDKASNSEAELKALKGKYDRVEEDVMKIQEWYKKQCSELERRLSGAEDEVSRTRWHLARERHIAREAEMNCDMYRDKWRRAVNVLRDAMDEVDRL